MSYASTAGMGGYKYTPPKTVEQQRAAYETRQADGNAGSANLGQGLQSHTFQGSKDYAQRIAGINPEESLQGAAYYTMGGRTFKNTRGAQLGTYEGDTETFSQGMQNYLKGKEELDALGPNPDKGKYMGIMQKRGDLRGQQQGLIDLFNTMTGSQRDEVIQQTGLTVDQLVEFQSKDTNPLGRRGQFEIQNYNDGKIDRSAERMLQESIQQRQTSNGLYQSQASAAGEGNAMAALQAGRMREVTPTLMVGTLDPTKLMTKDHQVPLEGMSFDTFQAMWGNKPPRRGDYNPGEKNAGNPGGYDPNPATRSQNISAFGSIDYNQVNAYGRNQKDPFALMYGNGVGVGAGGFFGG